MIFIMLCTVSGYLSWSAEHPKQEEAYWIIQWEFIGSLVYALALDNEITKLVNI